MEKYKIDIPVLLIGFNRPDLIKRNLDNLSQFSISKMYVSVDGPRSHVQGEKEKVDQVIDLVKGIDFCDSVDYRINEVNKGCEITETSAISWVLEKEEYVIVLEDDIIAHESFFRFMDDMLNRYKYDDKIAMVSGCNYTPIAFPNNEDYCFCQSGHIWGWATWRRVWKGFDLNESIKDEFLSDSFLLSHTASSEIANYTKELFYKMREKGKGNNTWDYMFTYYRITRGLLSIVPKSHLTSNIGLFGLHAKGETKGHNMAIDDIFVAIKHPQNIFWNKEYDVYHFENWIAPSKPFFKGALIVILKKLHLYSVSKRMYNSIKK